jgi:hypothetical protein
VDQVFDEANEAHERGAESLREVGESISPIQEKKRQAKDRFDSNKGELMQLHVRFTAPLEAVTPSLTDLVGTTYNS